MQEAVCTLCTSFGSWTFFGLFPFKGSAYGAYDCIRKSLESGLCPTVRRHWDTSCPSESKVHTAVHTAFGRKTPIDPLSGNGAKPRTHGVGWNIEAKGDGYGEGYAHVRRGRPVRRSADDGHGRGEHRQGAHGRRGEGMQGRARRPHGGRPPNGHARRGGAGRHPAHRRRRRRRMGRQGRRGVRRVA